MCTVFRRVQAVVSMWLFYPLLSTEQSPNWSYFLPILLTEMYKQEYCSSHEHKKRFTPKKLEKNQEIRCFIYYFQYKIEGVKLIWWYFSFQRLFHWLNFGILIKFSYRLQKIQVFGFEPDDFFTLASPTNLQYFNLSPANSKKFFCLPASTYPRILNLIHLLMRSCLKIVFVSVILFAALLSHKSFYIFIYKLR